MKNIIIVLFCFLSITVCYAQDTKPTKQETMDWIAGKFKDYINSSGSSVSYPTGATVTKSYKFISFSNSIITFSENSNSSATGERKSIYLLDLTKISKIERYSNSTTLKLKGSVGMLCEQGEQCKTDFNVVTDLNFNEMSGEWKVINLDNETDLLTRFETAFQTLIQYNLLEKPKEKF